MFNDFTLGQSGESSRKEGSNVRLNSWMWLHLWIRTFDFNAMASGNSLLWGYKKSPLLAKSLQQWQAAESVYNRSPNRVRAEIQRKHNREGLVATKKVAFYCPYFSKEASGLWCQNVLFLRLCVPVIPFFKTHTAFIFISCSLHL